jgi:hypothetical protein
MQLCEGKAAPLRRIKPGDGIVYYSPSEAVGIKDRFMQFTTIGTVHDGEPYRFDMGGGFVPHRRDVDWLETHETPIRPLLERLEFTSKNANWGYQLRFGVMEIGETDFKLIAEAMGVH